MKKLILTTMLTMLMMSGCADKLDVKVVDNSIGSDIEIISVNERIKSSSGFKEIQMIGENDTDEYIKLRYRIEWKDKDGFAVESLQSSWRDLPVYKNAEFTIHAIAPSKEAVKYMIYINK